ncbi:MAG TPA: FmdE family protein [Anaerolineales bacterium]|jgi:formylmethanofuran dehydrogenase subunit E
MEDLQPILENSSRHHSHLCPRQILGVRLGLMGMHSLQLEPNCGSKRLLVITETDGCFVDGLSAATGCTVGHRTLRVEDYGKTAATFVDTKTGRALRVAPNIDIRKRAYRFVANEPRHYFVQMQAYRVMPDAEMFSVREVALKVPVEQIVSHPGKRVECSLCGEEIMNEREIRQNGLSLCLACARGGYYTAGENSSVSFSIEQGVEICS